MDILEDFSRFSFSIIPCSIDTAAVLIKRTGVDFGFEYTRDHMCPRDVRLIYSSPDGPSTMPARRIGILLSETAHNNSKITLFVSSVNDGYDSMIAVLSKSISGILVNFRVSRMDITYPGTFIHAYENGTSRRTVYSMKDETQWRFWESGTPLWFEEPPQYTAHRKRDRLNLDVVKRYLNKLAFVSLNREFWINASETARILAHKDFVLGAARSDAG